MQTRRFGQDDALLDISDPESNNSDDDDENVSGRTRRGGKSKKSDKKRHKGAGRVGYGEKDEDVMMDFAPGNWTRSECYKIEKGLLTYGWNRWEEIAKSSTFRRKLELKDIEDVARVIVLFSLANYKGVDEKIKSFAYDLIAPQAVKEEFEKRNQEILAAAAGKRGARKKKKQIEEEQEKLESEKLEWIKSDEFNPDLLLIDEQYRKHLLRHANKVVQRIKLLHYIKWEILGPEMAEQVANGVHVKELQLPCLAPDGEPLTEWWDDDMDRSLVVGVYKVSVWFLGSL